MLPHSLTVIVSSYLAIGSNVSELPLSSAVEVAPLLAVLLAVELSPPPLQADRSMAEASSAVRTRDVFFIIIIILLTSCDKNYLTLHKTNKTSSFYRFVLLNSSYTKYLTLSSVFLEKISKI